MGDNKPNAKGTGAFGRVSVHLDRRLPEPVGDAKTISDLTRLLRYGGLRN